VIRWLGRLLLAPNAHVKDHCLRDWCDCCLSKRLRVTFHTLAGDKVGQACYRHAPAVMAWCVKKYPSGVRAEPIARREPVRID
jgi:hypothetical protein